jgi:hypothetical protein
MTTPQEFARQFIERLKRASDGEKELRAIVKEMDSLVYSATKAPVSREYKLRIVDLMNEALPRPLGTPKTVAGFIKEADNKRYLQLVQSLRSLLEG